MSIYEIDTRILDFEFAVEEGVIPEEAIQDTFEALEGEWEQKIDNAVSYIKNLDAEADAVKAEKNNLANRESALKAKSERIKGMVEQSLKLHGYNADNKRKIETPRNVVKIQKNPVSVIINDPMSLYEHCAEFNLKEYVKPFVPEFDKNAIKQALQKNSWILPGAELVQKEGIRIK